MPHVALVNFQLAVEHVHAQQVVEARAGCLVVLAERGRVGELDPSWMVLDADRPVNAVRLALPLVDLIIRRPSARMPVDLGLSGPLEVSQPPAAQRHLIDRAVRHNTPRRSVDLRFVSLTAAARRRPRYGRVIVRRGSRFAICNRDRPSRPACCTTTRVRFAED